MLYSEYTSGGNSDNDSGIPEPTNPTLKEHKLHIDKIGKTIEWDISSRKAVEQQLSEMDEILVQMDSDVEGGLITAEDKNMMTQYYNKTLAQLLDKGILHFFDKATYQQRGALYPMYEAYKKTPSTK